MSLPEWKDNIAYEEGDVRVVGKMTTGYPRYVMSFLINSIRRADQGLVTKFLHSQAHCSVR